MISLYTAKMHATVLVDLYIAIPGKMKKFGIERAKVFRAQLEQCATQAALIETIAKFIHSGHVEPNKSLFASGVTRHSLRGMFIRSYLKESDRHAVKKEAVAGIIKKIEDGGYFREDEIGKNSKKVIVTPHPTDKRYTYTSFDSVLPKYSPLAASEFIETDPEKFAKLISNKIKQFQVLIDYFKCSAPQHYFDSFGIERAKELAYCINCCRSLETLKIQTIDFMKEGKMAIDASIYNGWGLWRAKSGIDELSLRGLLIKAYIPDKKARRKFLHKFYKRTDVEIGDAIKQQMNLTIEDPNRPQPEYEQQAKLVNR